MKQKKCRIIIVCFIMLLLIPMSAFAQLLSDPKGDIIAPPGTDLLLFYYRHVTGSDFYRDGNYVGNVPLTMDVGWFRYAHYGQIGSVPYLANLIIPWGTKELTSGGTTTSSSGMGDITATFVIWFLNTEQFQGGFNYTLQAPTGEYRHEKTVNMGSNMWYNQPELLFVYFPMKKLTLEMNGAVGFYSKNSDFGAASNDLEKDPIYIVSGHLTYDITPKLFISGSGYWNKGAEQEVNGVTVKGTEIDTVGVMATLGFWVDKFQILAQYQQDLNVEYGHKTNGIRLRLAYLF